MKKITNILCTVCIAVLMTIPTRAISQSINNHELRAYGVMPFSDFAKTTQTESMLNDGRAASCAGFGAGIGYRYAYRFSWNLEFFGDIDVLWNPVSSEMRDVFSENNQETSPNYINIPLAVGLNFVSPLETFEWYFSAGAGVNINKTTSAGWANMEFNYETAFSAVIKASAGILLKQHYTIGLSIMSLGKYTIKLTEGNDLSSINPVSGLSRSMLVGTLYVGYKF